jgi:hypothetical protein
MDLRPGDRTDLDKDIKVAVVSHPLDTRLWVHSARRGVAAAAMLGVIVGGYYVGYSFSGSSDQESGSAHLASNNDADATSVTFGLLDMTTAADRELMAEEDEGFGLFALAAREGQS